MKSANEILAMVKEYGDAVHELSMAQPALDGPNTDGSYAEDEARKKISTLLASIEEALQELEGK